MNISHVTLTNKSERVKSEREEDAEGSMETVDLLREAAKCHTLKMMHINSLYCLAQEVFFHGI